MDPHRSRWIGEIVCSGLLLGLAPSVASAAEDPAAAAVQAKALYAEGRYTEAQPLLETLDGKGQASGPLLYRLAFCQRSAGDASASTATEARALAALEKELPTAREVDVPFYLANAYHNGGRTSDALRVATEATERLGRGEFARPTDAEGMFQVGKLLADKGDEAGAAEWYGRAADAFIASGQDHAPYLVRASRVLADRAVRTNDFAAAQKYLSILAQAGQGSAADFDRLAVASARSGRFADAAAAWRRAKQLDPSFADRGIYGARIAEMAAALAPLPQVAPSGKAWGSLDAQELEALMKEHAAAAKEILAQLPDVKRADRKPYRERLRPHETALVAAALEYTLQGQSIREAAFVGGYAPLLLDPNGWRVRPNTPTAGAGATGDEPEN